MTFQKRKKSHDFPRLFAQFPMIPMTLQTPRFENGYLIIDSYLREGDRHVSFLSFEFLMLMILMIFQYPYLICPHPYNTICNDQVNQLCQGQSILNKEDF